MLLSIFSWMWGLCKMDHKERKLNIWVDNILKVASRNYKVGSTEYIEYINLKFNDLPKEERVIVDKIIKSSSNRYL